MLLAALARDNCVLLVADTGCKQSGRFTMQARIDYLPPWLGDDDRSPVEPDTSIADGDKITGERGIKTMSPDKLDRLPGREPCLRADDLHLCRVGRNCRTETIRSLANDKHLVDHVNSLLDNLAVNDSQPVSDSLRRFGAFKIAGYVVCDVWAVIDVSDAAGTPVRQERLAASGVSAMVSGEAEPYVMPDPILSPDPADIQPLDDVGFACPGCKQDYRNKRLAIERGIESIAAFLKSLEPSELDLLRMVLTCGS